MKKNLHRDVFLMVIPTGIVKVQFKWQNMAGAGAEAEIMDKGGAGVGAENKLFRLRNTDIFPCNCFQFSALLSVLCTYRMLLEILSMTVKEEGIFGGIELGSGSGSVENIMDPDPAKLCGSRGSGSSTLQHTAYSSYNFPCNS